MKIGKFGLGGHHFSNRSEIQKSLKYPIGGGGANLFGIWSQIFPIFDYDASPNYITVITVSIISSICRFEPSDNYCISMLV